MNNLELQLLDPKEITGHLLESKREKEILDCICALRNSGGGRLRFGLSGTSSTSEVKKWVDIIKNTVGKVMSDTNKNDLLAWIDSNKIIFLVKGSKEIVTMEYNMYIIEDGEARLVPSTKSASEVRSLLRGQKKHSSGKQIVQPFESCGRSSEYRKRKGRSDANRGIMKDDVSPRAGFYGVTTPASPLASSTLSVIRNLEMHINKNIPHDCTIPCLIKGQPLQTELSGESVKIFEDASPLMEDSVDSRIIQEKNNLLEYVAAFAICGGGELYYGVSPGGIVCGEVMSENQKREVCEQVKMKIGSMVLPKYVDKSKLLEIAFLLVHDEDEMMNYQFSGDEIIGLSGDGTMCRHGLYASIRNRYVIKKRVNPCSDGLFAKSPVSYHVVKNKVEMILFPKWLSCLNNSNTMASDGTNIIDFEGKTVNVLFRMHNL